MPVDVPTLSEVIAGKKTLLLLPWGMDRAHTYGTSPSNQRIEAWWSFLRRGRTPWWMELFSYLVDQGIYHVGHVRETDWLRICFMNVLRRDLDEVVAYWNMHRIQPIRGARCPPGVPDELYYLPQLTVVDCLHRNLQPLSTAIRQNATTPTVCDDNLYLNSSLANILPCCNVY